MLNSQKTVVTGGAGFIGSNIVANLINEGRNVVVVDDFSSGSIDNLKNLGLSESDYELRKLDLRNYAEAFESLDGAKTVFHMAARIGGIGFLHGNDSLELSALQNNFNIDANVFKACLERKVKNIIYPSSVAVYDLEKQYSSGAVFSEDDFRFNTGENSPKFQFKMVINPDGGYGLAKLLGELQLNLMNGANIGIARIFNIYGKNEPTGLKAHAIADLIQKAINYPQEEFTVWGDGDQARDYLYVSDCAGAFMRLEERISKSGPAILTVNIGSGRNTLLREVAEIILKVSGKKINPTYDLSKPVGPKSRAANIASAKNLLGWRPEISLEQGLEKTYLWIKELNGREKK